MKEFRDMKRKKVWFIVKKNQVPTGRRLIGCKWVFKLKKNGVYRARLVALGYSQIPGVDFTDHSSPVVNDISFRILLILWLLYDLDTEMVDIETAFLYGDLEQEIYMKRPEGLEK